MSANDGADADHPWIQEPGRMAEDLRHLLNQARDALLRPPLTFDTLRHGLPVQRLLNVIRKALKKGDPERLLELERLDPAAAHAQASVGGADAPGAPRTQPVAGASDALSSLTAAAEIERLTVRLDDMKTWNTRLERENRELRESLASYTEHGTADDFRAYAALGTVAEVGQQLRSQRATIATTVTAMKIHDQIATYYESVLGPLLLGFGRRSIAIDAILRVVMDGLQGVESPPPPLLLASLADIDGCEKKYASVREALDQLHADIQARDDGSPDGSLPGAEQLEHLAHLSDIHRADLRERLTTEIVANLPETYLGLLEVDSKAGRAAQAPSAATRSRRDGVPPTPEVLTIDSDEDSTYSPDTSSPRTPRRRRSSVSRPDASAPLAGEDAYLSDEDDLGRRVLSDAEQKLIVTMTPTACGRSRPSGQTAFNEVRLSAGAAFDRWDKARPRGSAVWPKGPPQPIDLPPSVADLAYMPWRLKLFDDERVTPNVQAHSTLLAQSRGGRFLTAAEAAEYYATRPWQYLRETHPEPVSFDPRDPRFRALYVNILNLWVHHPQALWERTHHLMVDPKDNSNPRDYQIFFAKRRDRNTKFSSLWNGVLTLLWQAMSLPDVDADLFLDPFIPWAPVFGVILLFAEEGQTAAQAVAEADDVAAERAFFLIDKAEHPIYKCGRAEHIQGKFLQSAEAADERAPANGVEPTATASVPTTRVPSPAVGFSTSSTASTTGAAATTREPTGANANAAGTVIVAKRKRVDDSGEEKSEETPVPKRRETGPDSADPPAVASPSAGGDPQPKASTSSVKSLSSSRVANEQARASSDDTVESLAPPESEADGGAEPQASPAAEPVAPPDEARDQPAGPQSQTGDPPEI